MRAPRACAVAVIALALVLGWGGEQASAAAYLGEFCWQVTLTENETGPTTGNTLLFRLGVTQMGGQYYSVQGTRTVTNPPAAPGAAPVFLHGAGFVSGTEVIITANSTYDGTPEPAIRSGRSFQLRLNPVNFNGTLWSTFTDFDVAGRTFADHYVAGPATFTACP